MAEPERVIQTAQQAQANIDALFAVGVEQNSRGTDPAQEDGTLVSPAPDFSSESGDRLCELPVGLLVDFPKEKHPFRPYTAQEMDSLKEDIRLHGILQPLLVRPHPTMPGHYELIAGHNRRTGAQELGYTTLPCIVRQMDDDEALLQMISSNLRQRTGLLPSEKAWAYRYEMEALNRQGIRRDLTSGHDGTKLETDNDLTCGQGDHKSRDTISDDSGRTVQRYIRLTYLQPSLLDKVDERKLPLSVGENLSFLSADGQQIVENFFFLQRLLPITQPMSQQLREMEAQGDLNEQALEAAFLSPPVIGKMATVSIRLKKWKKYFSESATQQEVVDTIETALKEYFERRNT